MKVLAISNLYPPYVLGGYEILCGQVMRELESRGHQISVLTSTHGVEQGVPKERGVSRLLQLYLPFSEPPALKRMNRLKTNRFNYQVAAGIIRQEKPDLVFVWSQLRLTLGAARAAEDSGLPVVYTFNDEHIAGYLPSRWSLSPINLARYAADRLIFRSITLADLRLTPSTCISEILKSNLVRRGVPVADSRVIYQGIPLESFPFKDSPGSLACPLRLLYVGQLHAYKGVHTLIEAVGRSLARPDWPETYLSVVGEGPEEYTQRLHGIAKHVHAQVRFWGKVAHSELPRIYREHDIFIFPSIWQEPFGLTHLEAMASGTTVVSTTEGGQGEFLRNEENCLAFPKEDVEALAACLTRLVNEPHLGTKLAMAGRKMVESRFTLEKYVSRLEELLAAACGRAFKGGAA